MDISYEHANPRQGNESFLIRIGEEHTEMTPCLLVDAGDGVDTDVLLDDDEYLAAILLTHAHLDHYHSLGEAHRDGAPVLTSVGTASILEDVLTEGATQYGLSNTEEVLNRVEAISEWHNVLGETLRVRPVPVGHAPGACGFLIRTIDGDDQVTMLATGDFTQRDAAGYRGFDAEAHADVDILFLTAATTAAFEENLTDIVATISERTNAGSRTLCTASGLTGVHLATLLAGVDEELEIDVPVILAGQVAKLYTALDYEYDRVKTVPEFASPDACFDHGAVTIAGPEVPVEGSSARLFDAIADDPSGSVVQVQGGNTDAATGSDFAGTISSHRFSNHPSEAVLDDVVETISPTHVVVTHQRGKSLERYKDKWNSFSWATGSRGREILYRDGVYVAPPWVSEYVERQVRNRTGQFDAERADAALLNAVDATPAAHQCGGIDLGQEGVDIEVLRDRLHIRSPADASASTTSVETTAGGSTQAAESVPTDDSTIEAGSTDEREIAERQEPAAMGDDDEPGSTADTDGFTITVDPAISLLAQQRAETADTPLGMFIRNAVNAYLADILRGGEPWDDVEDEADSLSLEAEPVLSALLSSAATDNENVEAFALACLRDAVGVDEADGEIPIRNDGSIAGLLDAVVENGDSPSESPSDVVEDALRRESNEGR